MPLYFIVTTIIFGSGTDPNIGNYLVARLLLILEVTLFRKA